MLCKQCFRSTLWGFISGGKRPKKNTPSSPYYTAHFKRSKKTKHVFIWTRIVRVREYHVNANITSSEITEEAIKSVVGVLAHVQLLFLD